MRSWGIFGKEGKSERWKGEKVKRREEEQEKGRRSGKFWVVG